MIIKANRVDKVSIFTARTENLYVTCIIDF